MHGLLLLVGPEGVEATAGNLDDLETNAGNISLRVAGTTETGDEDLVVLIDEGHSTITGHVGRDSLVVLLELDSDTLTDGRVRLLGLDGNLLDDDTGGVRGAGKRLLPLGAGVLLLVTKVGPELQSAVDSELARGINSTRLVFSHFDCSRSGIRETIQQIIPC